MQHSLKRCCARVAEATKTKDRLDAMRLLRDLLASPSNVDALPPTAWTLILSAAIFCLQSERDDVIQKRTISSQYTKSDDKLRELAHAFRQLVATADRSQYARLHAQPESRRLIQRTVSDLFKHVRKLTFYRGDLFLPVALEYLKMLNGHVLLHKDLRDHLDVETARIFIRVCDRCLRDEEYDRAIEVTELVKSVAWIVLMPYSPDSISVYEDALVMMCNHFARLTQDQATLAHLLISLTHLLLNLAGDVVTIVRKVAPKLTRSLLTLWSNKSMKRSLVMLLHILTPIVFTHHSLIDYALLNDVYACVVGDLRTGSHAIPEPIFLQRLGLSPIASSSAGQFSIKNKQRDTAWVVLDLATRIIRLMILHSDLTPTNNDKTAMMMDENDPPPAKRARVSSHAGTQCLDGLLNEDSLPLRRASLQVMILLMSEDGSSTSSRNERVKQTVMGVTDLIIELGTACGADAEVQSLAYISLSVLFQSHDPFTSNSLPSNTNPRLTDTLKESLLSDLVSVTETPTSGSTGHVHGLLIFLSQHLDVVPVRQFMERMDELERTRSVDVSKPVSASASGSGWGWGWSLLVAAMMRHGTYGRADVTRRWVQWVLATSPASLYSALGLRSGHKLLKRGGRGESESGLLDALVSSDVAYLRHRVEELGGMGAAYLGGDYVLTADGLVRELSMENGVERRQSAHEKGGFSASWLECLSQDHVDHQGDGGCIPRLGYCRGLLMKDDVTEAEYAHIDNVLKSVVDSVEVRSGNEDALKSVVAGLVSLLVDTGPVSIWTHPPATTNKSVDWSSGLPALKQVIDFIGSLSAEIASGTLFSQSKEEFSIKDTVGASLLSAIIPEDSIRGYSIHLKHQVQTACVAVLRTIVEHSTSGLEVYQSASRVLEQYLFPTDSDGFIAAFHASQCLGVMSVDADLAADLLAFCGAVLQNFSLQNDVLALRFILRVLIGLAPLLSQLGEQIVGGFRSLLKYFRATWDENQMSCSVACDFMALIHVLLLYEFDPEAENLVMSSLINPHHQVRLAGILASIRFCKSFDTMDRLKKFIKACLELSLDTSDRILFTMVLAVVFPEKYLVQMSSEFLVAMSAGSKTKTVQILDWIAPQTPYGTRMSLLDAFLPSQLILWAKNGKLMDYPCVLHQSDDEKHSLTEFLAADPKRREQFLSVAVQSSQEDALDFVLALGDEMLSKRCAPKMLASVLPLFYSSGTKAIAETLLKTLQSKLGLSVDILVRDDLAQIVLELLKLTFSADDNLDFKSITAAANEPKLTTMLKNEFITRGLDKRVAEPSLAHSKPSLVVHSIMHVLQLNGKKLVDFCDVSTCSWLLSEIAYEVIATQHGPDQIRYLQSYRLVLCFCFKCLSDPMLLKLVMAQLAAFVASGPIRPCVMNLICFVWGLAGSESPDFLLQIVGPVWNTILKPLLEGNDDQHLSKIAKLLGQLVQSTGSVLDCLDLCFPLPRVSGFDGLVSLADSEFIPGDMRILATLLDVLERKSDLPFPCIETAFDAILRVSGVAHRLDAIKSLAPRHQRYLKTFLELNQPRVMSADLLDLMADLSCLRVDPASDERNQQDLTPRDINRKKKVTYGHMYLGNLVRDMIDIALGTDLRIARVAANCIRALVSVTPKSILRNTVTLELFGPVSTTAADSKHRTTVTEDIVIHYFKSNNFEECLKHLSLLVLQSLPEGNIFLGVTPLVYESSKFASKVLPLLILVALNDVDNSGPLRDSLSPLFNQLLGKSNVESKSVSEALLGVLRFLRQNPRPAVRHPIHDFYWLDVDYLLVSKACRSTKSLPEAILYFELWLNMKLSTLSSAKLGEFDEYEYYKSLLGELNDPDTLHGFPRSADLSALTAKLHQDQSWNKLLLLQSGLRSGVSHSEIFGLTMKMHLQQLTHLMLSTSDIRYELDSNQVAEAAWRNAQWSLDITTSAFEQGPDRAIFNSLKYLRHETTDQCSKRVMDLLDSNLNDDSISLHRIQFAEIVDVARLLDKELRVEELESKWMTRLDHLLEVNEPVELESLLVLRVSALNVVSQRRTFSRDHSLNMYLLDQLALYSQLSRESNQASLRVRFLSDMVDLARRVMESGVDEDFLETVNLIRDMNTAYAMFSHDETGLAIETMKRVWNAAQHSNTSKLSLESRIAVAEWTARARNTPPLEILQAFYPEHERTNMGGDPIALLSMAHFAFEQYRRTEESGNIEQLRRTISSQQESLECLKVDATTRPRTKNEQNQLRIQMTRLSVQILQDQQAHEELVRERNIFLLSAMKGYLLYMGSQGKKERRGIVHRACSLWFENTEDDQVSTLVSQISSKIASHEFLGVIWQMSALLQIEDSTFQRSLHQLICRITAEHPHHCVWQLLALKYARTFLGNSVPIDAVASSREKAAESLLVAVSRQSTRLGRIVTETTWLHEAYNQLAYLTIKKEARNEIGSRPVSMPSAMGLSKPCKLESVAVPTIELEIDPTLRYEHIESVEKIMPQYSLVGGINCPKRISLISSSGRTHHQLVKGNDDLRQDAILEQVFDVVNKMLASHVTTRKRSLSIRSYKVIPLSNRSGVLQWLDETSPIGEWLNEAHRLYRPKDWTTERCKEFIKAEMQKKTSNIESRYKAYLTVLNNFKPVFQFFFYERLASVDANRVWKMRSRYTKSVAVSSIIGYVIGLGDRHSHNILLDTRTAEVIHIDLGIAFNQGELLSIPECVPFRLTQDMVDGMGLSGVEGLFRKSCEESLKVLRQEKETIMMLLNVLRYDPLYSWSAVSVRNNDDEELLMEDGHTNVFKTRNDDIEGNVQAARALFKVEQHLSNDQAVASHVDSLIKAAVDPRNLSRMYYGWQPWL